MIEDGFVGASGAKGREGRPEMLPIVALATSSARLASHGRAVESSEFARRDDLDSACFLKRAESR